MVLNSSTQKHAESSWKYVKKSFLNPKRDSCSGRVCLIDLLHAHYGPRQPAIKANTSRLRQVSLPSAAYVWPSARCLLEVSGAAGTMKLIPCGTSFPLQPSPCTQPSWLEAKTPLSIGSPWKRDTSVYWSVSVGSMWSTSFKVLNSLWMLPRDAECDQSQGQEFIHHRLLFLVTKGHCKSHHWWAPGSSLMGHQ